MVKGHAICFAFLSVAFFHSGAQASNQPVITNPTQSISLDDLFEFTDPDHCDWGKQVDRLIDSLWVYEDDNPAFNKLDVPRQFRSAFGIPKVTTNADGSVVVFPLTGTLGDLRVTTFESFAPVGGDPPSLHLTFEGNKQIVRQKLEKLGISVNVNGHSIVDGDIYSYHTYITANDKIPTHTDLICLLV